MNSYTLLFLALLQTGSAFAELGTVTATTISHSRKKSTTTIGSTQTTKETRQTGVWVHFGPVAPASAKSPYEVQCFFITGSATGSSIFDSARQVSDLPTDAEFFSRPLTGKTSSYTSYPIEVSFGPSANQTSSGTLSTYSESAGSTLGGWIVRVLENGKVVRIEASKSELKDYAAKAPEKFDAAISRVKPSQADPDSKPATGFGSTLLDRKPK